MKIKWWKTIRVLIVSTVVGLTLHFMSGNTGSTAEAQDMNGSGQIVFRGFISGAGLSYLATDPVPDISVSPASYDWGDLWVGFTDAEEVIIANGGTEILNISGITLSDNENFTFIANGGNDPCGDLPITIDPGTSCTILVKFRPQSETTYRADLSIDCDDPDTSTVDIALTGTGVPNTFPFGDVNNSINVDGGCSIGPAGGSGEGEFNTYGWLILAVSWFGIPRKRKEIHKLRTRLR